MRNASSPGIGPRVRLRVIPLDPYLPEPERLQQRHQLGNAYSTLHTLGEIVAAEPDAVRTWLAEPATVPHGGEPLTDVLGRTAAWLATVPGDGHTVAITHPAVVRSVILGVLGAAERFLADGRRAADHDRAGWQARAMDAALNRPAAHVTG